MGEVAYKLYILPESKVHNIFHVPPFKKAQGYYIIPSKVFPPLDDEGKLVLVLGVMYYKEVFGEMEGPDSRGCDMEE